MRIDHHLSRWTCLVLLAIALAACSGSKPEATAHAFYRTVAAGKTEQAIDMFSTEGLDEAEMTMARGKLMMAVGAMQADIQNKGGLKDIKTTDVSEVGENRVEVTSELTFGNGQTDTDKMRLAKEKDGWKVLLR